MSTTYGTILRRPGALGFSSAGLIARFPMSMVGISTILAVQELYGSYSAAGTVSAANVVAVAVGAPALARLVDAHGQSRIMLPATLGSAAALIGLVVATQMRAPLGVLLVLSTLAGLLGGSFGSLVRSRWTHVLDTPEQIHTAFSLEAAFDEVAFIIGPVLATVLCTSPALPATSGWIAAVALQVCGGLWFFSQRATEPVPQRRRRRNGARAQTRHDPVHALSPEPAAAAHSGQPRPVLRHGAVVAVIAVFLASGAMFGANDVAAVAFATELGMKSAAGTVLAAWGVGSFTAALVYGSRAWHRPLWQQFLLGTTALAVGASTLMFAPNLLVLGVLMALTGMAIAPTITTGNSITQVSVAPSQLTEGLAWVGTAMNIGVSLGSLLGGHAIDAAGSHGGYLLVAAMGWIAVVICLIGLRALRRARPHHSLPTGTSAGGDSEADTSDAGAGHSG
ncbi:MFS transporter [Actinomyces sp.]|uniref:MFS transporter n=1 Tax=Actinomyces sp. TaxID=29317 RepID=UPI0026DD836C|nr:MFS transporter [Actinomyces sp.]MDO4900145.1 MFS transporter [Actinomyces sp.]